MNSETIVPPPHSSVSLPAGTLACPSTPPLSSSHSLVPSHQELLAPVHCLQRRPSFLPQPLACNFIPALPARHAQHDRSSPSPVQTRFPPSSSISSCSDTHEATELRGGLGGHACIHTPPPHTHAHLLHLLILHFLPSTFFLTPSSSHATAADPFLPLLRAPPSPLFHTFCPPPPLQSCKACPCVRVACVQEPACVVAPGQ